MVGVASFLLSLLFVDIPKSVDAIKEGKTFEIYKKEETEYITIYKGIRVKKDCDIRTGFASWYGPKFHGRRTANGEIYDQFKLTAAMRDVPLGTYVLVINLENEKKVVVRINDRGPYIDGRIIDLSFAAAYKLDMVEKGVAQVLVIPLECLSYKTQEKLLDNVIADILRSF